MLSIDQARPDTLILRLLAVVLMAVGMHDIFHEISRTDHLALGMNIACITAGYLVLAWSAHRLHALWHIWILAGALALLAWDELPRMSDDYYRFYWDGLLILRDIHPYAYTPSEVLAMGQMSGYRDVFASMNSPDYYAVYAPIVLYLYAFCAWISSSVEMFILMVRGLYVIGYMGLVMGVYRLLIQAKLDVRGLAIVALHPLLLLEGIGQLHIEALMMIPVVWGVYMAKSGRSLMCAGLMACAACLKLTAGVFWPFMLPLLGWRRWWRGTIIYGLILTLGYAYVLVDDGGTHYLASLRLYYTSFEFNASIYYVLRWLGYQVMGYNSIHVIGPSLGAVFMAFLVILWLRIARRTMDILSWTRCLTWIFLVYLWCSTTIHPWYILPVLVWLPVSKMRSVLAWSLLLPLTYFAYHADGRVYEYPWLLAAIYGVVGMMAYWDWRRPMDEMSPSLATPV